MSIAEHCYRQGCEYWVTGASDYCSEECESIARRQIQASMYRIGDHARVASAAMDRLRKEAEAALAAYEHYLATLKETKQ